MNWGRTKSIFIICFLLLDVFLIFEMYMRQQNENIEDIPDGSSKIHNYKIETVVPALPRQLTFLRGTRVDFTRQKEAITKQLNQKSGTVKQKISLSENGRQLTSTFAKPMSIAAIKNEDVQKKLLNMIYQGQDYKLWQSGEDKKIIRFAQAYQGRPVYVSARNRIQMLDFTVQKKDLIGYRQSYFKLTENKKNHFALIDARQAINNLADRTDLVGYSTLHIKGIELCYLNTVGDESAEPLIFVPAWHLDVHVDGSGTTSYFVNAVTGNVQSLN
ncbi:two-component system regulatory protein YycI [Sporolactobacillus sp. CPB3-1]|uniref:Two-component system regulatory protein YycI n=1 Tax=Sporolactobacillus mangiferae TaxID=2940498 RepID=A0ABT0MBD2_9BACL|nr:two-component system regulatory protein YycI [Sporolactobacillus mangiferae]MCL1632181.1 two-component system regulatory protein YycI [Sporolactobacillus mangiferae]